MAIYRDLMSGAYAEMARKFKVNPEHCDNPDHYQSYIWQASISDQKQGMGVTHVFIFEDEKTKEKKLAGYVTLRGSSLIMDSGDDYKLGYPAVEIAELAVDQDFEHQNIGTDMVKFAIGEAIKLNETEVGFQYVVLCADPMAVGFYSNENLRFKKLETYKQIPREYRNKNCTPMFLKIAT